MLNIITSIKPKLLSSIKPGKNPNGNQALKLKNRVKETDVINTF